MKRIALLDAHGNVLAVSLWDGLAPWDPVAAGLCASIVDVTDRPDVAPGWTYPAGMWTPPPTIAAVPDPLGFVTAVASDGTLSPATRIAATNALAALVAAVSAGNAALIGGVWALVVAAYAIPAGDQATVHGYALTYAIPGI